MRKSKKNNVVSIGHKDDHKQAVLDLLKNIEQKVANDEIDRLVIGMHMTEGNTIVQAGNITRKDSHYSVWFGLLHEMELALNAEIFTYEEE